MARPNTRTQLRRIARQLTEKEFQAVHAALHEKRHPTKVKVNDIGPEKGRRYYLILDSFDEDLKDE